MFVEIHLLQNFAPSCLNRDDTNSPKDCDFGGYRRARISSQCLKRAIRLTFADLRLLDPEELACRTKRLVEEVAARLAGAGHDAAEARAIASVALGAVGLTAGEDGKTQYLLFLGQREIGRLADAIHEHWSELAAAAAKGGGAGAGDKKAAKGKKAAAKDAVAPAVVKALASVFAGEKAADLALFGRMIADNKAMNVDAASQVAHAISTNKVSMEMDYFTAVDDLQADEESGAGMIGTVEFNSACFYRYANVDVDQLHANLQGDEELTRKTVEAFVRASVAAIPTGKQNSMAAHNPPSLVLVVARDAGLWSLANAFVQPCRPDAQVSLVDRSVTALADYWGKLSRMYGKDAVKSLAVLTDSDAPLGSLADHRVDTLDLLVQKVNQSLRTRSMKKG